MSKDDRDGAIVGNITATDIDGDMGKATYTGSALGMSVMTVADGNKGQKAVKSGEFEALVKLTATFGASPTVKVTISEFKGEAVDGENWSIELVDAKLNNAAPDGRWHARSHWYCC